MDENANLQFNVAFTDTDSGIAGDFGGYSISPDPGIATGSYDEGSGFIIFTGITFDYEEVQSTSFNLTVWDKAPHPFEKSTMVQITINIVDVNDVCPELERNITSEMITIYENETFILNYTIVDPDTSNTLSVEENTELANHSAISVIYGVNNITGKLTFPTCKIF